MAVPKVQASARLRAVKGMRVGLAFALAAVALGAPAEAKAAGHDSTRWRATPASRQALRAGEAATLRFTVERGVEETEILLSLDGGATFPLRVTRERAAGTYALFWRVPSLPTARARLALRVGDEEKGEVIRDVSPEFAILPASGLPLEDVREPSEGDDWRAGEALEQLPPAFPLAPSRLAGSPDSLRALRLVTHAARTRNAAPAGTPPETEPESLDAARPARIAPPASPRLALNPPRRE
jgi:hypothetical protein